MTSPDDDLREFRATMAEIRVWFLGNGSPGVFSRIERIESELFGDERTRDVGLVQDVRSVMQSSSENTRLLHQVRTMAIVALVSIVAVIVMHAGQPGWLTDFVTWLVRLL